jgi:hypothetical protein
MQTTGDVEYVATRRPPTQPRNRCDVEWRGRYTFGSATAYATSVAFREPSTHVFLVFASDGSCGDYVYDLLRDPPAPPPSPYSGFQPARVLADNDYGVRGDGGVEGDVNFVVALLRGSVPATSTSYYCGGRGKITAHGAAAYDCPRRHVLEAISHLEYDDAARRYLDERDGDYLVTPTTVLFFSDIAAVIEELRVVSALLCKSPC